MGFGPHRSMIYSHGVSMVVTSVGKLYIWGPPLDPMSKCVHSLRKIVIFSFVKLWGHTSLSWDTLQLRGRMK